MHFRPIRVAELADRLGREFRGDGEFEIGGVSSLEDAGPTDLAFVRSKRWQRMIPSSKAGALIVAEDVDPGPRPAIRSPIPAIDFARAVRWIAPEEPPAPGVHPSASVAAGAQIDPTASIGASVAVGARSIVGARTVLFPNATVYEDVEIGADCRIHAGVVLREGTRVGDRVVLHPGVVLGGDGFGYELDRGGALEKVPQVGRVVVEDDVEIGANSVVDRATLGATRIGRGAKIDDLVMIAHNCDVGAGVVIAGQSGLAGSTVVERGAILMAQTGAAGHLRIGEGALVAGRGGVTSDVSPRARVAGFPARDARAWLWMQAALRRLPQALRRLAAIERRLNLRDGGRDAEPDRARSERRND